VLSRTLRLIRDRIAIARDPIAFARHLGVRVGEGCRLIGIDRSTFGSEPYLVSIGDHVTITAGVRFVTHDGGVWVLRTRHPDIDVVGRITIGSNVFIGLNAILLPGIRVADDSVVGAGAVVARDVPAGSVVAGAPARVVRTIEEYETEALKKALHVRGLRPEEKRRVFLKQTESRATSSPRADADMAESGGDTGTK